MKQEEIKIGKSYHNGMEQVRKVFDVVELIGYKYPDVLFTFEEGPEKGRYGRLLLDAFAKWAKGIVEANES